MAHDREFASGPAHFGGEDEEEWGHGPWGRGPRGHHGPRGRGGRGFGPGFGPWFGPGPRGGFGPFGHFGHFGPFGPEQNAERDAFMRVGFDVARLVRAALLASGGNSARISQLRGILEKTRDELNAFLGQPAASSGGAGQEGTTPTSDTPGQVL